MGSTIVGRGGGVWRADDKMPDSARGKNDMLDALRGAILRYSSWEKSCDAMQCRDTEISAVHDDKIVGGPGSGNRNVVRKAQKILGLLLMQSRNYQPIVIW